MNRVLAGMALVLLPASASASPPKFDAAKLGWHADLDRATAEAKRTGKPIFLVFRCEP
jgi:hypothetical protein